MGGCEVTADEVVALYSDSDTDNTVLAGYIYLLHGLALGLNCQLVFEIGVDGARSTHAFLSAMQQTGGRLVSCDVEDCSGRVTDPGLLAHWQFLHMSSIEMAQRVWHLPDLVYVNGCHSYESVSADVEQFWPLVKPDGLMVLHDTRSMPSGPGRVAEEWGWKRVQMVEIPTLHGLAVLHKAA